MAVNSYSTSQTTVTLPPLTAGKTYAFGIDAHVDAAAKVETQPNRSALPIGSANVVSALFTVASGAASPQIHGDAKLIRELAQPNLRCRTASHSLRSAESCLGRPDSLKSGH